MTEITATSVANRIHDLNAFVRKGTDLLLYCRRRNLPLALALFDLRSIRAAAGAACIEGQGEFEKMVARRLLRLAAGHGLAGQTGAEEFALLLPALDVKKAHFLVRLELDDLVAQPCWPGLDAVAATAPEDLPYAVCDSRGEGQSLEAWLFDLRERLGGQQAQQAGAGAWRPPEDLPPTVMMPLYA